MEPNPSSLFSLTIDPVTKANLTETAKWAKFLAIVGMTVIALVLIATIWSVVVLGRTSLLSANPAYDMNPAYGNAMKAGMIIGSIIMLAVAFFPLLFLLRFANSMSSAMRGNDQQRLNTSFQNLKTYFRYLGIVVLIVLVLYAVVITFAIMGAAAFSTR